MLPAPHVGIFNVMKCNFFNQKNKTKNNLEEQGKPRRVWRACTQRRRRRQRRLSACLRETSAPAASS